MLTVDAFVVGVPKAATTTLAAMLASHPSIAFSSRKEPSFFWPEVVDFKGPPPDFVGTIDGYEALFDRNPGLGRVRMEASHYIGSVDALARVKRHNNGAKLIVILRDPVERAVASYRHLRRDGHEPLSFDEALREEPRRISENYGLLFRYRQMSDYRSLLRPIIDLFPPQQILYILFEEMTADFHATVRCIERFLSVPSSDVKMVWLNEGRSGRAHWLYSTVRAVRPVARTVLPRRLSSFIGQMALEGLKKYGTTRITVSNASRDRLSDLYDDLDWIARTTGLPCAKYWPVATRQGAIDHT